METLGMLAVIASNYSAKNGAYEKACLEAIDDAFWAVREKYGDKITDSDKVTALHDIISTQLNDERY